MIESIAKIFNFAIQTPKAAYKSFISPRHQTYLERFVGMVAIDDAEGQNQGQNGNLIIKSQAALIKNRVGQNLKEAELDEYQKTILEKNMRFEIFSELSSIGAGYELFNIFGYMMSLVLFLLSVPSLALAVYYFLGNSCSIQNWCQDTSWIPKFSIANRLGEYSSSMDWTSWMNLGIFLLVIQFLIYWRRYWKELANETIPKQPLLVSEFSVLIRNFPPQREKTKEEIESAIESWVKDKARMERNDRLFLSLVYDTRGEPSQFLGMVFVTFPFPNAQKAEAFHKAAGGDYSFFKKFLIRNFNSQTPWEFEGSFVYTEKPEEPEGVLWDNLRRGAAWRLFFKVFTLIILSILSAGVCIIAVFITNFFDKVFNGMSDNSFFLYYLRSFPILYSVILVLFCFGLSFVAKHFVRLSAPESFTEREEEVASYTAFFMFLVLGVITTAIAFLKGYFFSEVGLVTMVMHICFANTVITLILTLNDPEYLYKMGRNINIKKRKSFLRGNYTQEKFNEEFCKFPPFDFGEFLGDNFTFIYLAFFYFSTVPLATVVSTIGFVACSLAQKRNLIERSSLFCTLRPNIMCGFGISFKMKIIPLIFALGCILRDAIGVKIEKTGPGRSSDVSITTMSQDSADLTIFTPPNLIMLVGSLIFLFFPSRCVLDLEDFRQEYIANNSSRKEKEETKVTLFLNEAQSFLVLMK